jgi:hypothetical protein
LLLIVCFCVVYCYGQEHALIKKWETDTLLKTPESVLYYQKGQYLFVSNINVGGTACAAVIFLRL